MKTVLIIGTPPYIGTTCKIEYLFPTEQAYEKYQGRLRYEETLERNRQMYRRKYELQPMPDLGIMPHMNTTPKRWRNATLVEPRTTPKIGRNEPCPCGSGKKHKNCCLN